MGTNLENSDWGGRKTFPLACYIRRYFFYFPEYSMLEYNTKYHQRERGVRGPLDPPLNPPS